MSVLRCSTFFSGLTLTSVHDHWKNHSFDYTELCQQSDVDLFNTLSRFAVAFLLRSKRLFISWLQSPSSVILEAQHCFCVFPSVCHEVLGADAMILCKALCTCFWKGWEQVKTVFPFCRFTSLEMAVHLLIANPELLGSCLITMNCTHFVLSWHTSFCLLRLGYCALVHLLWLECSWEFYFHECFTRSFLDLYIAVQGQMLCLPFFSAVLMPFCVWYSETQQVLWTKGLLQEWEAEYSYTWLWNTCSSKEAARG